MKLSVSDVGVTVLILLLSALLIHFYLQETGRTTVRKDEVPLGTIVFKKLRATRRVSDKLVWERLRNNSPVYEADTLRTAASSEAVIHFDDDTALDMLEHSMVRLDFNDEERTLELLSGKISLLAPVGGKVESITSIQDDKSGEKQTGIGTGGYTIKAGDKKITVSEGSHASMNKTEETLSVEVLEGEIEVTHGSGNREMVAVAQELEVDLRSGSTRIIEHSVFPLTPQQNARYIIQHSGKAKVEFSWKKEGTAEAVLEVADNSQFDPLTISASTSGNVMGLEIVPGTWYWRVRTAGDTVSSVRRFALYSELPPQPVLPASGTEIFFRKKLPDIRFSWKESEYASFHIFEVDSDSGFSNPAIRNRMNTEGITIDTLGEGTWYWRVLPRYSMDYLEPVMRPEVMMFVITRREDMTTLTPTMPLPGAMFLVQEAREKGTAFSWVPHQEAVEYDLSVSRSSDMEDAVFIKASKHPWLTLTGTENTEATVLEEPGEWYWAVRWKDNEGNISSYSKPRLLRGIGGTAAVRLSFPPDGYTISDSLIGSTRFAWKSNVPGKAVFQLSKDESFAYIAWEEPADTGTLIGRDEWTTGIWYWRIRTLNTDGSVFFDTPSHMFRVVGPLPQPRILAPVQGQEIHLRREDSYVFSWDKVPEADYYRFTLSSVPDKGVEALEHDELHYTAEFQNETHIELPFGEYPEGAYRVVLQAFSTDKESSTRNIGLLNRSEFSFTSVSRMELLSPSPGAEFEGLDARRQGIELSWRVPHQPDHAELVVSKDPDCRTVLSARPSKSKSEGISVERLTPGAYYWTVKGELYGLDISALDTNRFTVLPIPPLPAPTAADPRAEFRFGPHEFRENSIIRFSWDAVAGATHYEFLLFRDTDQVSQRFSGRNPVIRADSLKVCEYILHDFSILERGEYNWTVKAQAFDRKGELEQDGMVMDSPFSIDLPWISVPEPKGKVFFYGR